MDGGVFRGEAGASRIESTAVWFDNHWREYETST
jgi:hypothetical protein